MVIHVYPVDPNLSVVSNLPKIQNKNTNSVLERSSLITRNTTTRRMSRFPWKEKRNQKSFDRSLSLSSLSQPCITWRCFSLSLIFPISYLILLSLPILSLSLPILSLSILPTVSNSHSDSSRSVSCHTSCRFWRLECPKCNGMCPFLSLSLLEWNKHSFGLNLGVSVCWSGWWITQITFPCDYVLLRFSLSHSSLPLILLSLFLFPLFFFGFNCAPPETQCVKHSLHLFSFVSLPFFFFFFLLTLFIASLLEHNLYVSFPCLYFSFAALLSSHFFSCCVPSFGFCSLPLLSPLLPFSFLSGQSWERISGLLLIRAWKENERRNETQEKTKGKERRKNGWKGRNRERK